MLSLAHLVTTQTYTALLHFRFDNDLIEHSIFAIDDPQYYTLDYGT